MIIENLEKREGNKNITQSSLSTSDNQYKYFSYIYFVFFSTVIPILQLRTLRPRVVGRLAWGHTFGPISSDSSIQGLNH